jgi:hypothetical protein
MRSRRSSPGGDDRIAPGSDGGSAITSYTATSTPDGKTGNCTAPCTTITVTGLSNGTAYTFKVKATNGVGTGAESAASNAVTPAAPPTFAGSSATGTGTITASFTGGGASCDFDTAQYINVEGDVGSPPAGTAPAGVSFPQGLFDFTTTSCTPGSTITMTIVYPSALPPGTQYYKYGPQYGPVAAGWYVLPAVIVGNTITFSITDGQLGDDDLTANGTIVDQGGPGAGAGGGVTATGTPIPTLSDWAMILLVMLLAFLGIRQLPRRR